MTVVDASIVVRVLQNRSDDHELHERMCTERFPHAPALIDAEVTSAIRGLLLISKPDIRISTSRAEEMHDDFAGLPLVRHPMQPHQRRALALRNNLTAYDAMYVALSEALEAPLLTDDRKYAKASGHEAAVESRDPRAETVRPTRTPQPN